MSRTPAFADRGLDEPICDRSALSRFAPSRLTAVFGAAAVGLLAVLLVPVIAADAAEPINLNARTARDLADLCGAAPRQPGSDAKINFCHGFAQATVDMALKQPGGERPFCFPNPAPRRSETLSQFVGWVHANPDRQKLSSTESLLQFMGERFPCNK